jgi:Rieske Fe-S protein
MKPDTENTSEINRRKFIIDATKLAGLAALGATSLSLLSSCESFDEVTGGANEPTVIPLSDITFPKLPTKKPASGTIKSFQGKNYGIPVIIVKLPDKENEYACYSSLCTHNNCFGSEELSKSKVRPPQTKQIFEIVCDCHGSKFDAYNHGKVTQGPAEKPLKEFPTKYDSETKMLTIYF